MPAMRLILLLALASGCVDLSRPAPLQQPDLLGPTDAGTSDAARADHEGSGDGPAVTQDGSDDGATNGHIDGPDASALPDLATDPVPPAADRPADLSQTPVPDARGPDAPNPPVRAIDGTACAGGDMCTSGLCVDGVCCESTCNSPCYSCNQAGKAGKCLPIPAGTDPDNDCTASLAATCGLDGFCNGAGTCRLHPAGTTCVMGSCSGSTAVSTTICDGSGHCGSASVHECAPYLCGGGICRTSCALAEDCKAGYVCSGTSCVPPTVDAGAPPDAPAGTVLVVDDFSDGVLARNTMGGAVTFDNQNVALVGGAVQFTWNGRQDYSDFIETYLQSFCAYDIRAYRTLRFRMSVSAGPRVVHIFLPFSNNTCATAATPLGGMVTVTTTMQTFDVDISNATRDKALFIEFSPVTQDGASYLLDDVQLVP
jgi:hypothetical protein